MLQFLAALALVAPTLFAQTISGSLVGSVRDTGQLAVVGADVILVQTATGAKRELRTNERGDFGFVNVQPGAYTLSVKADGFKVAERKGIQLSAAETLPLGEITLEVGSVAETVTVTSQGATVQTASSERSGVITGNQVENIQIRGRNVMSLLTLMPGVVGPNEPDSLNRAWAGSVNGGRADSNSLSIDGMGQNQVGASRNLLLSVSQDAVSEVKILLSNFQAEYGRFSGANVQVITKSGTKQFHGLGSYFKRHEQFNANSFFNNRLGILKQRYRYNTWNYNIGGPVYIPGKFNRNRDKLFFFWSQEFWPTKTTTSGRQVTMPTELERAGDFSQSVDQNNALIRITDPLNRQPFAGNRIPVNRLDASGRAMLSSFPLPNFFDRGISAGRYNYVFNSEAEAPQRIGTLKLDYQLNEKHHFYTSYLFHLDTSKGYSVPASGGPNWNQMFMTYWTDPKQVVVRYQGVYTPTLVNELTIGANGRKEGHDIAQAELEKNQRDKVGFLAGQINPSNNEIRLLPNVTYGGIPGAVARNYDSRIPLAASRLLIALTDTLSKTMGSHILKVGVNAEREFNTESGGTLFNGTFDFSRSVNNPLDTNHPFANGLLGVFSSYREATSRPGYTRWATFAEWFGQDTWKVNRRLTLDLGLRFSWFGPRVQRNNQVSAFVLSRFDRSKMVQLIQPATRNGQRVGLNPVNGEVYPVAAIGAIAPGSGLNANGMVVPAVDKSYPRGLYDSPGVLTAPRIGFAWDPWGNGKTAVRGGFGLFYNRWDGSAGPFQQIPIVDTPAIFNATFQTYLNSNGLSFPQAATAVERSPRAPSTMNYNLSVQRNVGRGTVVDVAYVASLSRHLQWSRDLNPIPFGANFDPKNADPTNPRTPLAATFLRPILGYANINVQEWASTSNYHSLQVQANRRFARSVEFGGSWTWSKAMNYADDDGTGVAVLVPVRVWNYDYTALDRTHVLKANFVWELPRSPWQNVVSRRILDQWQMSGILSFVSGSMTAIGYSFVNPVDTTGTGSQGARVVLTGNPVLPKSERTFSQFFRTDVVRPPAVGTIGNAAPSNFRGPGINNWDLSLQKNIPIGEKVKVQFRSEFYNAWNHTQFSGVDAAARFDAQNRQVNARFGEITAARSPRVIQMALRVSF